MLNLAIHRSRPTIFCSDQCRHDTVQANHSRGGRVLELSGCAWNSGRALNPAGLLSEKTAEETRVEHLTSWSQHPLSSAQERAAVAPAALARPPVGALLVGEFRALAWKDMLVGSHQDPGNMVLLGHCCTRGFPLSFIVAHPVHKSKSFFYLRNLSLYDLWQLKVLLEFFFLKVYVSVWNWIANMELKAVKTLVISC